MSLEISEPALQMCSYKNMFSKYAANLQGNTRWSAILMKLQSSVIEITLWHECSPVNLLHIFRTRLEHLWMAASEPATSPTQKEGFFCKSITAQKMKFSIKDFPIKYDQIRRKLRLLEKPLMENFILCAVNSWKNNRKCLKIIRSQL